MNFHRGAAGLDTLIPMPACSPGTHVAICRIRKGDDLAVERSLLPESLLSAAAKRKHEFLAGRRCAQNALRLAGCTEPGTLAMGKDKLPQWPDGWRGSISHNNETAIAVATSTRFCTVIGVDLETWIDKAVAEEIHAQIAQPDELVLFSNHTPARALTLVFSAKETLYKALYPEVRQFRDFKAAHVVGITVDQIRLRLEVDWGGAWRCGTTLAVSYAYSDTAVCTLLDKTS